MLHALRIAQTGCLLLTPLRVLRPFPPAQASRQREYLEKTVDTLKRKLAKDSELHRSDNLRIMQENTALIREINELRREIRALKARIAGGGAPGAGGTGIGVAGMGRTASPGDTQLLSDGLRKELDMQRELISRLREDMAARDARIRQLESMIAPRPTSRERLPPMDGFPGSLPPTGPASSILSTPPMAPKALEPLEGPRSSGTGAGSGLPPRAPEAHLAGEPSGRSAAAAQAAVQAAMVDAERQAEAAALAAYEAQQATEAEAEAEADTAGQAQEQAEAEATEASDAVGAEPSGAAPDAEAQTSGADYGVGEASQGEVLAEATEGEGELAEDGEAGAGEGETGGSEAQLEAMDDPSLIRPPSAVIGPGPEQAAVA